MLLSRGNKNDYVLQNQQIIWKDLGATSAGLALKPPLPRTAQGSARERCRARCCPSPWLCPPVNPSAGGCSGHDRPLEARTRPVAGREQRSHPAVLRGWSPCPPLNMPPPPPGQITVPEARQGASFSPWKKILPARCCRFAARRGSDPLPGSCPGGGTGSPPGRGHTLRPGRSTC